MVDHLKIARIAHEESNAAASGPRMISQQVYAEDTIKTGDNQV
jgi:hypothetical protein